MNDQTTGHSRYALFLVFVLVSLVYSNTLDVPWHLDDYDNIVNNTNLHIERLDPDSIHQSLYWGYGDYKRLQRPVAMVSFALNWYIGRDDVVGYHLVNTAIHILAGFFLFLAIIQFYKTPRLSDISEDDAYFVALLTSAIWILHPIQTQAVTYIVQRMASMAAMFYILSIYFYLRGRLSPKAGARFWFWLGATVTFLLALGTKENSATLPVAVFLLEIIFFQDLNNFRMRRRLAALFGIIAIAMGTIGVLLFFKGDFSAILKGYNVRYFTPLERLLTQPRVLFFYLSKLFYPIPVRLSIAHDVQVSTSLFVPWTTLPAILGVFAAVVFGILQARKHPVLAFAVLFFFLNHIIESSILALELVFEHRNYLPSMFLFWPLTIGFKRVLDHYRKNAQRMHGILVVFAVLLLVGLGSGTYIRNMAWGDEKTLWEDTIAKAPRNSRAYHNLAFSRYEKSGHYEAALALYKKALSLEKTSRVQEALTLHAIAGIYYYRLKDYPKAYTYWEKAYASFSENPTYKFQAALALVRMQAWEQALACLKTLLEKHPRFEEALNLSGYIMLKLNRPYAALGFFQSVVKKRPFNRRLLLNLGGVFSMLGQHDRARLFLQEGYRRYPTDPQMLVLLVENSYNRQDEKLAQVYLNRLLSTTSFDGLQQLLEKSSRENKDLPIGVKKTIAALARKMAHVGENLDVHQRVK